MSPSSYLQALKTQVSAVQQTLILMAQLPEHRLLQAPAPGKWSAAQCLEHLNSYGRYYIPALENSIRKGEATAVRPATDFSHGWLGGYFIRLMQPKPDGTLSSRMKAPKDHTPVAKLNAVAVLREAQQQQEQLLQLLDRAAGVNIRRLKVRISISKLIKMSVGDTFGFLIAHETRHMMQAQRALDAAAI